MQTTLMEKSRRPIRNWKQVTTNNENESRILGFRRARDHCQQWRAGFRQTRPIIEHQEKGDALTVEQVLEEVHVRDQRDRERKVSPLVRAEDAVLVDNTAMGIEETARLIVLLAREREESLV